MEFVIVVGTYEHLLYGFTCLEQEAPESEKVFTPPLENSLLHLDITFYIFIHMLHF